MGSVVALLYSLAVVSVALGGFATVAGLAPLRERCFTVALLSLLGAILLPLVVGALTGLIGDRRDAEASRGFNANVGVLGAVVVGHGALATALLHRRLRASRPERQAADLEHARGRGRPRLSPEGREE
jgi:MFS family permease